MGDMEKVELLAMRAAELLPPAPCSGDAFSYLGWRELVWDTASRLGAMIPISAAVVGIHDVDIDDRRLITAEDLLALARQCRIDTSWGETCVQPSMLASGVNPADQN